MTTFRAERLSPEPIIHARLPGLEGGHGANINGPSLVRVPPWLPRPLGRYYLYFAHHAGHYLRMAWADELTGPWTVLPEPGVLHKDQGPGIHHIASPDVHVDAAGRRLRMYFHQPVEGSGQRSFAALSEDGLRWQVRPIDLGPSYFRVFSHEGWVYAYAMRPSPGGGLLLRSRDGITAFEEGPAILPGCRHAATWVEGATLHLFFSRKEDAPERILVTAVDLAGPWESWQPGPERLVLRPELDWEGAGAPVEASRSGAVAGLVHQLRDPGIYEEDGRLYLLYSGSGERALGIARLHRS
ncbi:MAG: hypothetical protein OXG13_06155 [Gemmatimonadaceae bacterium]|nr:hypothetical protein [Gemmatimonadaceae bacterium]